MKLPTPLAAEWTTWARTLVASIAAGWNVEHTAEGRHDWNWVTPAFDAARFTGDGTITWTVDGADRINERYARLGSLLLWQVVVRTSSTGGTASSQLRVTLPDNLRTASLFAGCGLTLDAGTARPAIVQSVDARTVAVLRADLGNWSNAASNNTGISFQVMAELVE